MCNIYFVSHVVRMCNIEILKGGKERLLRKCIFLKHVSHDKYLDLGDRELWKDDLWTRSALTFAENRYDKLQSAASSFTQAENLPLQRVKFKARRSDPLSLATATFRRSRKCCMLSQA